MSNHIDKTCLGQKIHVFTITICTIGLMSCVHNLSSNRSMSVSAKITFDQHEVVTSHAKHETVLTGFFYNDVMMDLAIVNNDENNNRRLRIYTFNESNWTPKFDVTLPSNVLFIDVANIGGRDRLITYESGQLNWFDLESALERPLVSVTSNFNPPYKDGIPHVDVTRDLNDDDRDDLVVPDSEGFRVFIQMDDGTFADPVKMATSLYMDRLNESTGNRYDPWVQDGRIHKMDYNQDGRSDLVFWNKDHFEVHQQDEQGLFDPVTKTFTTKVRFDSDNLASLVAPNGVRHRRKDHQPNGKMTGRVLYSLADMNGDRVSDLVVFSLEGGSLWGMKSSCEVYFGETALDGSTVFTEKVGTTVQSDGIPFDLRLHDFDHDGQMDITFTVVNPNIFKAISMIIGALLTQTVPLDYCVYGMDSGNYHEKPGATRKIKTYTASKSGEKVLFPSVLIGDVNGDGHSDLLEARSWGELRLFVGVPGPELLAKRSQKIEIPLPKEIKNTCLVDFNKDSKQDILIHHTPSTGPNRVTILISE